MDSDDDDDICTPPDILELATKVTHNLLPEKSRKLYEKEYNNFLAWKIEKKTTSFSENDILAYLKDLSDKFKPSSMWAKYSMLKSTLSINNNIDITKYSKVIAFLKRSSEGHKEKKSLTFTSGQIKMFLEDSPDILYLFEKVALIFGIMGACRRQELYNIQFDEVSNIDDSTIMVKVSKTKTKIDRSFVVTGNCYAVCKKYMELRPTPCRNPAFFLSYRSGKCVDQRTGINTFGALGKTIASFLNLPNPALYTGHCFRRTSATLLIDSGGDLTALKRHGGWKSSTVAESYIDESLMNKIQVSNTILNSIENKTNEEDSSMSSVSRGICVICLRTDRKLKKIPPVLAEYHDKLTEFMNEVANSKYCCECEYLLRKTYNFHEKCKLAAKTLIKWHRIKNKNKPTVDQLYLKLPATNLDTWTPEYNKVYNFNCSEMPDLDTVKVELVEETEHNERLFKLEISCEDEKITGVSETTELVEETEHNERLFKLEIRCEDEKITGVSETIVPNLNEDHDYTNNVFLNKLTDDFTTSAPVSSNSTNNKENKTNRNVGHDINQSTNIGLGPNVIDKIGDLQKQNDIPSISDVSTLTDGTKIDKSDDELTDSDESDLICLDDDKNDTILIDDDDIEYPDDASLNSDDDCDDYLIAPSPKRRKMKKTLEQIANITLSDEDFDENDVCDKQKITMRTKKIYSNDKLISTENNIVSKLEKITANLNDICENWEITCLQNVGMPNVSYDDVKKVTLKLLTQKTASGKINEQRKKVLEKKEVISNLAAMSADLDSINQNSVRAIEDCKIGLQDPKERFV